MALWNVTIPIKGTAFMTVEADTEEEAISKALESVSLHDFQEWDPDSQNTTAEKDE